MRSATQREYTTPTLKPGTRYEVQVWAVTSIGRGNVKTRVGTTYESKLYKMFLNVLLYANVMYYYVMYYYMLMLCTIIC